MVVDCFLGFLFFRKKAPTIEFRLVIAVSK
jgi:hypothetical protein